MTENEKNIKQAIRCVVGACDETCYHWSSGVCCGYEEVEKGLEKALEEIQRYKAMEEKLNGISVEQLVNGFINTVENQTEEPYERGRILTNSDVDMWNEYRAIGTVEEFKKIEESFNAISDEVWYYILAGKELLERYEAIGTIEEFKALKEKNTKKRFNIFESHGMRQFVCGCCDRTILTTDNYCSFCGQKLDWQ